MTTVRFIWDGKPEGVVYSFGLDRAPQEGEFVNADGSDSEFPEGGYYVDSVHWYVTLRGPREAVVHLVLGDGAASREEQ